MPDTKPLLKLIDVATLLGRSPETVRRDLHRNPAAVSPQVVIPGARHLRWSEQAVVAWLGKHTQGGQHE